MVEVTSYAEVWIEIGVTAQMEPIFYVTSYAEVWIEMTLLFYHATIIHVTSYAEVWIEITFSIRITSGRMGHLLRGGVD